MYSSGWSGRVTVSAIVVVQQGVKRADTHGERLTDVTERRGVYLMNDDVNCCSYRSHSVHIFSGLDLSIQPPEPTSDQATNVTSSPAALRNRAATRKSCARVVSGHSQIVRRFVYFRHTQASVHPATPVDESFNVQ